MTFRITVAGRYAVWVVGHGGPHDPIGIDAREYRRQANADAWLANATGLAIGSPGHTRLTVKLLGLAGLARYRND